MLSNCNLVLWICYNCIVFRLVEPDAHDPMKTEVSSSTVRDLAMALLQIEQMLEAKYMNPPLGMCYDLHDIQMKKYSCRSCRSFL